MTYEEKLAYVNGGATLVEWINSFEAYIIKNSIEEGYRPTSPFYASWNITNRCNLSCKYCSNANSFTTLNEMSLQDKLETVNNLVKMGIKHIRLLGGEPTIVPCFAQIIDAILKNNIYCSFSTNGIGVTEDVIAVLKKYSPLMYKINISCDSCVEENNDVNRGTNSFKIAEKAVKRLLTIPDVDLTFFSVITNETKNDIIITYRYLKDLKVPGYGISVALKKGRATDKDVISAKDIVDDVIEIIKDSKENPTTAVFANLGYYKSDGTLNEIFPDISEMECNIAFREKCNCCITRIHIESDGNVYPCDHLKYSQFVLGNILEMSNEQIWNNEVAIEIASMRRKDKLECAACKVKTCSTGCMGLAYGKYGTIYRKDPNCEAFIL